MLLALAMHAITLLPQCCMSSHDSMPSTSHKATSHSMEYVVLYTSMVAMKATSSAMKDTSYAATGDVSTPPSCLSCARHATRRLLLAVLACCAMSTSCPSTDMA